VSQYSHTKKKVKVVIIYCCSHDSQTKIVVGLKLTIWALVLKYKYGSTVALNNRLLKSFFLLLLFSVVTPKNDFKKVVDLIQKRHSKIKETMTSHIVQILVTIALITTSVRCLPSRPKLLPATIHKMPVTSALQIQRKGKNNR
jgi:hypothetical protein